MSEGRLEKAQLTGSGSLNLVSVSHVTENTSASACLLVRRLSTGVRQMPDGQQEGVSQFCYPAPYLTVVLYCWFTFHRNQELKNKWLRYQ